MEQRLFTSHYQPLAAANFSGDTLVAEGWSRGLPGPGAPAVAGVLSPTFNVQGFRGVRILALTNSQTADRLALTLKIVDRCVSVQGSGMPEPYSYLTRTIGTITFDNSGSSVAGPPIDGQNMFFCDTIFTAWSADAYLTARMAAVSASVQTFAAADEPAELIISDLLNAAALAFQVDATFSSGTRWNFLIAPDV